jgi:hypothetical protein
MFLSRALYRTGRDLVQSQQQRITPQTSLVLKQYMATTVRPQKILALNNLSNIPGAKQKVPCDYGFYLFL